MRVFDGGRAADDYMSAHTLAFSTPELTLKRFAFWLADMVPDPAGGGTVPRIDTFVDEKDFEPARIVDDDKYTPSGAVRASSMYGDPAASRFCAECGSKVSQGAKFCAECGTAA